MLYSFLFNLRLSKTRFGPCKVIYGFFKAVVYFFFVHCSTLSLSTSDYLKHVLYLVKSFMDFFRQCCIFFFDLSLLYSFLFKQSKTCLSLVKSFVDFFNFTMFISCTIKHLLQFRGLLFFCTDVVITKV